jgi:hypothetical protein
MDVLVFGVVGIVVADVGVVDDGLGVGVGDGVGVINVGVIGVGVVDICVFCVGVMAVMQVITSDPFFICQS